MCQSRELPLGQRIRHGKDNTYTSQRIGPQVRIEKGCFCKVFTHWNHRFFTLRSFYGSIIIYNLQDILHFGTAAIFFKVRRYYIRSSNDSRFFYSHYRLRLHLYDISCALFGKHTGRSTQQVDPPRINGSREYQQRTIFTIQQIQSRISSYVWKTSIHADTLTGRQHTCLNPRNGAREPKVKTPVVLVQLIERSIVKRCHQIGSYRLSRSIRHTHPPFFLTARLQFIPESFPFQRQFLFRFRSDDCRLPAVQTTVSHKSKVYGNAITIHFLIGIAERFDFITQRQSLRSNSFVSTIHVDQQINILFAGSNIQGRRSRIAEFVSILIEPVDSRIRKSSIQA